MPQVTAELDAISRLETGPMHRRQIIGIAVIVMLSALDGFDVLAISFAMPSISSEWHLGRAAIGTLLATGLIGMALGSLALAPLADVFGRRLMVIGSLLAMAVGMALSAVTQSVEQLAACRLFTGLGIGSMVAVLNPLAAELSNARRRPLALALMAVGFPIGGVIGGLVSALVLRLYTWEAVFALGAAAAIAFLPVVILLLPESLAYLTRTHRPDRLERVNTYLARFGHGPLAALPERTQKKRSYNALFAPANRFSLSQMTVVNLSCVMVAYYFASWLPQLVADAGFAPSTASLASAASNVAGVAGGLSMGLLAHRLGLQAVTITALIGVAAAVAVLGLAPPVLWLLVTGAMLTGFFLFASAAGIYAILPMLFEPEVRATGTGFVIGVGRVGSALAPAMAGWMFAAGLSRGEVSAIFSLLALFSAGTLLMKVMGPHRAKVLNGVT